MALMAEGYMGGFVGKLGPAIGYRWRGKWCLRSLPLTVRNPRTEAQQAHRMLFRDMVRLAGRMREAASIGLREAAAQGGMTECNLFVRMNKGQFTADGVDYDRLIVSLGPVAPVAFTEATLADDGVLAARFEKNPLHRRANSDDEVLLYIYNIVEQRGLLAAPVRRGDGRLAVALPDGWQAAELRLYAMVRDSQGRTSDTIHVTLGTDGEGREVQSQPSAAQQDNIDAGEELPSAHNKKPLPTLKE